jgi:transcriptional regulator with XRE-family HTH domain
MKSDIVTDHSKCDASIEMRFGRVVKVLRKRLNISQQKLADLADLHRTYISDIERGTRNVSLQNIEKLSQALQFPLWRIFYEMTRLE